MVVILTNQRLNYAYDGDTKCWILTNMDGTNAEVVTEERAADLMYQTLRDLMANCEKRGY